jgi:lipoprotein-anchoring transpeptidase ErfK/SrfK
MSRSHRISRGLIGLLGVTIILGLVFYFQNVSRSSAKASKPTPPLTPPVSARLDAGARPPKIISAPATAPATQPTTRPTRVTRTTPPDPTSRAPLTEAAEKRDAGELPAARSILNTALLAGSLSTADSDAARKMLGEINQVVVFSPKRFADDTFGGTYSVQTGDLLRKIADKHDLTWEMLGRLNGLSDPKKLRAGATLKVLKGPFHAVVSKSNYTMDIYLGPPGEMGSMYVTTFPVGLGADDSTPTGTWLVEAQKKIKNPTYFSPRGEGIIDADDPKNPLGERWIGLTGIDGHAVGKASYGIHGTIDPASIGRQASMGCIRLQNEDVMLVFDLLVEGKSTVVVKE